MTFKIYSRVQYIKSGGLVKNSSYNQPERKFVQTRIEPGSPMSSKYCINRKAKPWIEDLVSPVPVASCRGWQPSTGRGERLTGLAQAMSRRRLVDQAATPAMSHSHSGERAEHGGQWPAQ
jgi:hypothetical protein